MAFNYVVTAQKPTNVSRSVVGNFTSADDINLIISKSTRLEIHTLSAEGLKGVADVPIFGRISALRLFRPTDERKDLLFLLTESNKFCILSYDESSGQLLTRANGDVSDKVGRPCEVGQIAVIDPECRLIGMHVYNGRFKIIPIGEDGKLEEAFIVPLDVPKVIDIVFLHNCKRPTMAVLWEDYGQQRHVHTYEINMKSRELSDGPFVEADLDNACAMLIPVQHACGVLVPGGVGVVFLSDATTCSVSTSCSLMKTFCSIGDDGSRYLLGDISGELFLLYIEKDGSGTVKSIKLESLGKTSQAATMSYLDSGVVFVGSCTGDSQLVRLHPEAVATLDDGKSSYVEVLDVMTNMGPIVNFTVVDLDRQGQGQVVTCSGAGSDGSLRIIRNGIGFTEQASVELPGVKGVWSLKDSFDSEYDRYLVLSFVGETRILGMNENDELDEADIAGFDSSVPTLWCSNVVHDQIVQITNGEVRMVNLASQELVSSWKPPQGKTINIATANPSQVVVATSEGNIVVIQIQNGVLVEISHTTIDSEVSCMDISPIGDESMSAKVLAVGTWSMKLLLYSMPSLEIISSHDIGGDIMPRSIILTLFNDSPHLLCGLGDGTLLNYRIADGRELIDRKRLAVGTKPISLRHFKSKGSSHVFASSDRPTVIYTSNSKILYSNLNENDVSSIASFNTPSFPDTLAIIKQGCLAIGTMDSIQKLHVRTVPVHEQPRRIAHLPTCKAFLVCSTRLTMTSNIHSYDTDSLHLLDDQTFEIMDTFKLKEHEVACSISAVKLAKDPVDYFAVGTAFALPGESESSNGRILLFQLHHGKLYLSSAKDTRGAVYNINVLDGKLVAGINSRIQLYIWEELDDGTRSLIPTCSFSNLVLALYVAVRGNYILVGDLMKSLHLIAYNAEQDKLELRARDFSPAWMTACEFIDENHYIGSDANGNIFTCRLNNESMQDEDRSVLEVVGRMHLGDLINHFEPGSLVMETSLDVGDISLGKVPKLLFGTINGMIGVIASLDQEIFAKLMSVQQAMRKSVLCASVGGFDHIAWRQYQHPTGTASQTECGFIDGDLMESFADLSRENAEAICLDAGLQFGEVSMLVETLSRLK